MIAVGLDLSNACTGWSVWGGETGRIRPKGLAGAARRRWITHEVTDVVYPRLPALVVIEDVYVRFVSAAKPLFLLHGVVLDRLHTGDQTLCVAYVTADVLKAFLAGKGKATKPEMVAAAQALGYKGKSHDEADAFGLSLIGHQLLGGADHRTPQRSALLASVAWEVPLPEVPVAEVTG